MDIFEQYLLEHKEKDTPALTDASYNNFRQLGVRKGDPMFDKVNQPLPNNYDLVTYGDAVIKLCLCEVLYGKVKELTNEKQKYESDKFFVEVIAKHYDLLEYIKFDRRDKNILQNYKYSDYGLPDSNRCKYIATAVIESPLVNARNIFSFVFKS